MTFAWLRIRCPLREASTASRLRVQLLSKFGDHVLGIFIQGSLLSQFTPIRILILFTGLDETIHPTAPTSPPQLDESFRVEDESTASLAKHGHEIHSILQDRLSPGYSDRSREADIVIRPPGGWHDGLAVLGARYVPFSLTHCR